MIDRCRVRKSLDLNPKQTLTLKPALSSQTATAKTKSSHFASEIHIPVSTTHTHTHTQTHTHTHTNTHTCASLLDCLLFSATSEHFCNAKADSCNLTLLHSFHSCLVCTCVHVCTCGCVMCACVGYLDLLEQLSSSVKTSRFCTLTSQAWSSVSTLHIPLRYNSKPTCFYFLCLNGFFTFTCLCPDPVLPGHCAGDVPFLLPTLWPQPAGPVGSLTSWKLLQPKGACKQPINTVWRKTVPVLIGFSPGHVKSQDILIAQLSFVFPFAECPTLCFCVFWKHTPSCGNSMLLGWDPEGAIVWADS